MCYSYFLTPSASFQCSDALHDELGCLHYFVPWITDWRCPYDPWKLPSSRGSIQTTAASEELSLIHTYIHTIVISTVHANISWLGKKFVSVVTLICIILPALNQFIEIWIRLLTLSFVPMSAPFSNSSETVAVWPFWAAKCKEVPPSYNSIAKNSAGISLIYTRSISMKNSHETIRGQTILKQN